MHFPRHLVSSAISLTLFACAGLAEAGPVAVSFSGEIDTLPTSRTGALTSVMLGDAFTGTFQVDFNRALVSVTGDDVLFSDVILDASLNLQVGQLAFTAPNAVGTVTIRDSSRGDFVLFGFQFGETVSSPGERFAIEFLFQDFAGTFFDVRGELLPEDPSRFDRATLRIFPFDPRTDAFGEPVIGRIRSASVPEPGEAACLAIGFIALALLRLRSVRAQTDPRSAQAHV